MVGLHASVGRGALALSLAFCATPALARADKPADPGQTTPEAAAPQSSSAAADSNEPVPGDIIITGTPSGVAMARTPQPWLKPGDVCEVEIEKIGVLRNPIVQGA